MYGQCSIPLSLGWLFTQKKEAPMTCQAASILGGEQSKAHTTESRAFRGADLSEGKTE